MKTRDGKYLYVHCMEVRGMCVFFFHSLLVFCLDRCKAVACCCCYCCCFRFFISFPTISFFNNHMCAIHHIHAHKRFFGMERNEGKNPYDIYTHTFILKHLHSHIKEICRRMECTERLCRFAYSTVIDKYCLSCLYYYRI